MPLQLDSNGNISTLTNDTGTYTWEDVVALNSPKMITWVTDKIYQWTGNLVLKGTSKLTVLNKIINISYGSIQATDFAVINFGEELNAKNGCILILDNDVALTYTRNNNNTRVNLYGCSIEVRYPGYRIDFLASKIIDCNIKFTGNTTQPGAIYIQNNGIVSNSIFKNIGWIELPGNNYTIKDVQFYDSYSTFLNFESFGIISISNFKTNSINKDYLTNEGGFRFINSSINLSNGNTGYGYQFGSGTQANYRSFVAYEHYLKLLFNNLPVSNALIKYIGFSGSAKITNTNGVTNAFLLDVEHNNYQLGNGNLTTVNTSTYIRTIKSYAHLLEEETLIVNSPVGTNVLPFSIALTLDSGVTVSQSIAETIIGITHSPTTITVTKALTLNQIYDSRKAYWRNNDNVNPPYLIGTTFNLNGVDLIVDGVTLIANNKFTNIVTTGNILYVNSGNTKFATTDINGLRYRVYGLPTKVNSLPVLRIKRLSTDTIIYPVVSNGEVYINLVENESYEIRADARGYIVSNFITINTGTSSELQIMLEELLDNSNNPIYGNGIQQEKDLISYNTTTNTIYITYDSNYPTISLYSAVDKLEEIFASNIGLEVLMHPIYENGKLVFTRNILNNNQSTIKIVPAINNTGDPELLFELVREGDDKPYALFDFSTSNGRTIKYPTTVNIATFNGELNVNNQELATAVWTNNVRTLTTSNFLTSIQESNLNNLDVAVSSRLASTSYVQAPTTAQIRTNIESSTILAKETTVASRASQTSVNLIPTTTLLTTDTRLNNLDTTISSRLPITSYSTPPTSTTIATAIWNNSTRTLTNSLTLTEIENSTVLAKEITLNTKASQSSINAIPINPLLATDSRLNNLDVAISTRLAAANYVTPLTASETTAIVTNALNSITLSGLTIEQSNKLNDISANVLKLKKLRGLVSGVDVIAKAPNDNTPGYLKTSDNDINLVITKNGAEEILSD